MTKRKTYLIKTTLLFLVLFFPLTILAADNREPLDEAIINPVPNPSAAYCEELGYQFVVKDTPKGQIGICEFEDGKQAPAWDFLRGKESTERSYCSQKGYKMKVVDDAEKCGVAYAPGFGCLVCVLENGREIEAADLLNMEKEKKLINICNNDGQCVSPETKENCPQDCLTPAKTGLRTQTKFEKKQVIFFVLLIIIILGGMFTAWYFLIRKKKEEKKQDPPADNRPDDTQY